jgi:hypothetical protein
MSSIGVKRKQNVSKKDLQNRVAQLEEEIIKLQYIAVATPKLAVNNLQDKTYYGSINKFIESGKVASVEEWESKNSIASHTFHEFLDIFTIMEMDFKAHVLHLDLDINKPYVSQEFYDDEAEEDEEEEEEENVIYDRCRLDGWVFKMNQTTYNSFVLSPPAPISTIRFNAETKQVSWRGGGSKPASWNIFYPELERDIFYVDLYKGWIVSLRLEDELLDLGAVKVEV